MLKLLKLAILAVLFLTLTSQIVKAEFTPYSSFPPYIGMESRGYCRPCQNISLEEAKAAYTAMSEAAGSTAMYSGKVALAEVCSNGWYDITKLPTTTPEIWTSQGYLSTGYTMAIGKLMPENAYNQPVAFNGQIIRDEMPGMNEISWQKMECKPSEYKSRNLVKVKTYDLCQLNGSDCYPNAPRRYLEIWSVRPTILIKKRNYTIFITSSKEGWLQTEMYTSMEPGNYTPVAFNLQPPTERVPQNKEPKQCAKDAFMDKFPFDFFNVGGSGNIQNCITTNFFGIRKELCGLQPIIKNFQIATTIAFIIAFYLYL